MGLFNALKVWASNPGNKTERADASIAAGWAPGEPPRFDEWNFQENARDRRINTNTADIRAVNTLPPGVTPAQLCAGNHIANDWVDLTSSLNYYQVGANVVDTCIGWDTSTNTAVLWILDVDGLIRPIANAWDLQSAPVLGSDLGLVYPATVGGVLSICCDAEYLYVMWWRDADGYVAVSQYSAVNGLFGVNANWTYTTGQDYTAVPYPQGYRIIDALDGVNLGLFLPRDSDPYSLIGVMPKTGTSAVFADGNIGSGLQADPMLHRVVSDGDHLFWLASSESGGTRTTSMASANISAPSSSAYTFQTVAGPIDVTSPARTHFPMGIVARSGCINFTSHSGRVYVFNPDEDSIDPVLNIDPQSADTDFLQGCVAGWDGLNLIMASRTDDVVSGTDALTFYKVPGGMCGPMESQSSVLDVDYHASRTVIPFAQGYNDSRVGDLVFDGRSMWYIDEYGNVIRITNTGGR